MEITNYLLSKGADICDKKSSFQKSSLHLAIEKSCMDTVEILLDKLNSSKPSSDMFYSQPQTSSMLCDTSFSSSSSSISTNNEAISLLVDSNGETPLHYAAQINNLNICERLLMLGFDLNSKSNTDKYPHDMCSNENLKKYLFGKLIYLWAKLN